MNLTETQKELISRGTMAVVAIALAVGATKLVFVLIAGWRAVPDRDGRDPSFFMVFKLLVPIIMILYLLSATLGCFVFCPWDKRRSDPGRVMSIADKVGDFLGTVLQVWSRF